MCQNANHFLLLQAITGYYLAIDGYYLAIYIYIYYRLIPASYYRPLPAITNYLLAIPGYCAIFLLGDFPENRQLMFWETSGLICELRPNRYVEHDHTLTRFIRFSFNIIENQCAVVAFRPSARAGRTYVHKTPDRPPWTAVTRIFS